MATGCVVVRPYHHRAAMQRRPVGLSRRQGTEGARHTNMVGEDLAGGVGGLLAFHNKDRSVGALGKPSEPIERSRIRKALRRAKCFLAVVVNVAGDGAEIVSAGVVIDVGDGHGRTPKAAASVRAASTWRQPNSRRPGKRIAAPIAGGEIGPLAGLDIDAEAAGVLVRRVGFSATHSWPHILPSGAQVRTKDGEIAKADLVDGGEIERCLGAENLR